MKHTHGGNIYTYKGCLDFSSNCNPLGTPASVKEAIRKSADVIMRYPQVDSEELGRAIAGYEGVGADQVICGNGAAEVIFLLCRALLPKNALLPAPTFAEYEQALVSVGAGIRYYPLREEQDFVLDEGILACLTPETDILFICNPNNPTGMLTDGALMRRILDRCRENGTFLAVDECFLDFVEEQEKYTLKECLDGYGNLLILKAFTKRCSMAGVRLGYALCGNTELLQKMRLQNQPWSVSTPAQMAGLAALGEAEFVRRGRETARIEAAYLTREMKALGLTVFPSRANYIFFKGPEDLFDQCLRRGILIRDCGNYEGLGKGYFRTAVRAHPDNEQLIRVLTDIRK